MAGIEEAFCGQRSGVHRPASAKNQPGIPGLALNINILAFMA